jgi:hypothetical protein
MGQDRVRTEADPESVRAAMAVLASLSDGARDRVMRAVVEAVYTFKGTGDPEVLRQLADDLEATVRVRQMPGATDALTDAMAAPVAPIRTVDEAFANLSS